MTASVTGAGPRAFVAAAERRPAGERPRFGTIAVTAIVGAAIATAFALWPAVSAHRSAAATRVAVVAAPAAATLPATPASTPSPAPASAVQAAAPAPAPPAAQQLPAPPATGASRPATAVPPPPVPAERPTPGPTPPLTFANHEVVGCCLALGGRWHDLAQGGHPDFHGPSAWTASREATATWNLGSPAGGQRWDSVRVLIWIPNGHARARVRLTVTATSGQDRTVRTFDVAERGHAGWLTIPGTFSAGTPTVRTGTITVRMAFLRPFTGADMAAGQAMFEWS